MRWEALGYNQTHNLGTSSLKAIHQIQIQKLAPVITTLKLEWMNFD